VDPRSILKFPRRNQPGQTRGEGISLPMRGAINDIVDHSPRRTRYAARPPALPQDAGLNRRLAMPGGPRQAA